MPNSPFCPRCLEFGELRHTYKVAGLSAFKCATCKHKFSKTSFDEAELLWKDNLPKWKAFMGSRLPKNDQTQKELKRIESLSAK